jgi:hypothetical protein
MVQLFQNFVVLEKLYVLYRCNIVGCEKVRQGASGVLALGTMTMGDE